MRKEKSMSKGFSHELILPNEDLPFKMFLFEGADGNYRRAKHWHRSVEIFLVQEGELVFYIDNQRIPLTANDFVIVNSNEIHSIEAPHPNTTIVVQIPVHCFDEYLDSGDYPVFSKQSDEKNAGLSALIQEAFDTYQAKERAYKLKVQSLFLDLLYQMVTSFMDTETNPENIRQKRHLERLSGITSYIKEHYREDITLEGVAARFGYSPTYLSRMFRQYADVSYKTYLLDVRTEHAMRDMMQTDDSLAEIAVRNGFPDGRSFANAFGKRYGTLPGEYRRISRIT